MADQTIRFDDGTAYERYMGKWSQLAGAMFLDWLAPEPGWRWLDVGCGNGAFTEMLVERCAPASVDGIDPSEGQLAFARTRPASRLARFRQGDAMALPFPDDTFDVAVMPLVIFFVPDPARGIAEMARVVRPGGAVTAYAWDMCGGGFPYGKLQDEMRALGLAVPLPPSRDASRMEAMRALWTGAGVAAVETREIIVQRTFADFDDYWTTILGGPSVGRQLAGMASEDIGVLKARMRTHLPAQAQWPHHLQCPCQCHQGSGHRWPSAGVTWVSGPNHPQRPVVGDFEDLHRSAVGSRHADVDGPHLAIAPGRNLGVDGMSDDHPCRAKDSERLCQFTGNRRRTRSQRTGASTSPGRRSRRPGSNRVRGSSPAATR